MEKTKIYVGVVSSNSTYSKIIKWFQWGNPNVHAFYLYGSEYKNEDPLIIEALAGHGVHEGVLSGTHSKNLEYTVYSLEVTVEQKEQIESFLKSKIGLGYDYRGILGFGFRKDTNKKNRYFCSELIYDALLSVGIKLFRTLRPEQVYPSLFVESMLLKEEYKKLTL